jgi:hypothetical protein
MLEFGAHLVADCLDPKIFEALSLKTRINIKSVTIIIRPLLIERAESSSTWTLLDWLKYNNVYRLYGKDFVKKYDCIEKNNEGHNINAKEWIQKLLSIEGVKFTMNDNDYQEFVKKKNII